MKLCSCSENRQYCKHRVGGIKFKYFAYLCGNTKKVISEYIWKKWIKCCIFAFERKTFS